MDQKTIDILKTLSESDWLKIYSELEIYAKIKCNRLIWNTGNKENLPDGFSPTSIAKEAITRFFYGIRKWNHDIYSEETPLRFLKSVVRSIVSDLYRKKSHQTAANIADESQKMSQNGDSYEIELSFSSQSLISSASNLPTPYEDLFLKEIDQRIVLVLRESKESKELLLYYFYRKQGLKIPEIAIKMSKNKDQIDRLRVTFSRRTKQIREEFILEMNYLKQSSKGGTQTFVSTKNG